MDIQHEEKLTILLEEYKQMRNEIRTSYGLYFSMLFGVIFTGIVAAFIKAPDNQWLYIVIPFLMCSWIGIVTFIRCNIQHISNYVAEIEKKINFLSKEKIIFYETDHAPRLWFSRFFKLLGTITALPLIVAYFYSVCKGYNWLKLEKNIYFQYEHHVFIVCAFIFCIAIIYLFIVVPEKTRFKK